MKKHRDRTCKKVEILIIQCVRMSGKNYERKRIFDSLEKSVKMYGAKIWE